MLERHRKRLQDEAPHAASATLAALAALLNVDGTQDALAAFRCLHPLFMFDRALVLEYRGDRLRCITAVPAELVGKSWDGAFFQPVLDGRILASGDDPDRAAWQMLPADLVSPGQPAIALPIGVQERRAVLLLVRAQGREEFDHGHLAIARAAAVVALAGLAMRSGDRLEAEIRRLELLVTQLRERKRAEHEWTRRAYFDDLTGLPNRLLLQERAETIIRQTGNGGHIALAFIDIDNFKHINDYYSHAVGDALLVRVASRIAGRLRQTDMLARVNGDEFLLLLDPVDGRDQVRMAIDQILADMKQPFHVDHFEIFTSASVGISLYPEHGRDYESLRRNADNAMYRVKSGSKGAALFYDPEMGRSIVARMEHEQQLRLAIRDNRFCCAFQPKVDIYSQHVVGFESLVRWRDENGESRSPGTFVSLAVELGLIDTITHFVLAETLKSIDRLDDSFGAGTTFSINVPASRAGDVNFMRPFIDALKSSGRAERLMLEVTEETFVAANPFQSQILPMLREAGVRISIDDFGTGYSSLASLADITADELKVDRSFITDIHQRPRSQSILKSIESLGLALGMSIVAEGVETLEELAYLQEATRIRHAQGFYFCKPFFLDGPTGGKSLTSENRGSESSRERIEGNRVRAPRGRGY